MTDHARSQMRGGRQSFRALRQFLPCCRCRRGSAAIPGVAERDQGSGVLQGVRNNQLVGYGLVVGLDGSGDQTTQTPFTSQSIINMLAQLGTTVNRRRRAAAEERRGGDGDRQSAALCRIGQQIDVTVSSMGNAKSLRGGTLVMTPLKGADGQIYAQAQGNLLVGGAGAASGGSKVVVNHLLRAHCRWRDGRARSADGARARGHSFTTRLATTDFGTTQRGRGDQPRDGHRVSPQASTDG
jgi:flagellar P-ring protein precursor FlgI